MTRIKVLALLFCYGAVVLALFVGVVMLVAKYPITLGVGLFIAVSMAFGILVEAIRCKVMDAKPFDFLDKE